jgi:hypothetical protein
MDPPSLKARDTADCDTPARRATSYEVARAVRRADGAAGGLFAEPKESLDDFAFIRKTKISASFSIIPSKTQGIRIEIEQQLRSWCSATRFLS